MSESNEHHDEWMEGQNVATSVTKGLFARSKRCVLAALLAATVLIVCSVTASRIAANTAERKYEADFAERLKQAAEFGAETIDGAFLCKRDAGSFIQFTAGRKATCNNDTETIVDASIHDDWACEAAVLPDEYACETPNGEWEPIANGRKLGTNNGPTSSSAGVFAAWTCKVKGRVHSAKYNGGRCYTPGLHGTDHCHIPSFSGKTERMCVFSGYYPAAGGTNLKMKGTSPNTQHGHVNQTISASGWSVTSTIGCTEYWKSDTKTCVYYTNPNVPHVQLVMS